MAPKARLYLDTSESKSIPRTNLQPKCRKPVANYVGLVDKLRNPTAAGPTNKWMTTGRVESHPVGVTYPDQHQPKPEPFEHELTLEEHEVTPEEYESFFGEDMSGSLSDSMTNCASARMDQSREKKPKKLQECEGFLGILLQCIAEEDPRRIQKPIAYQKPVIERYPYPRQIYTQDRSNEEYLAIFAALVDTEGRKGGVKSSQQQQAC